MSERISSAKMIQCRSATASRPKRQENSSRSSVDTETHDASAMPGHLAQFRRQLVALKDENCNEGYKSAR